MQFRRLALPGGLTIRVFQIRLIINMMTVFVFHEAGLKGAWQASWVVGQYIADRKPAMLYRTYLVLYRNEMQYSIPEQ